MSRKIPTSASFQLRILYGLPLIISLFAIAYAFTRGKALVAILAIVVALAIILAEVFFERRLSRVDEAKREFELALRNNPGYAIAHENLADILLHLARRSYLSAEKHGGKSNQLSGKMQALQPVLQLTLPKP